MIYFAYPEIYYSRPLSCMIWGEICKQCGHYRTFLVTLNDFIEKVLLCFFLFV